MWIFKSRRPLVARTLITWEILHPGDNEVFEILVLWLTNKTWWAGWNPLGLQRDWPTHPGTAWDWGSSWKQPSWVKQDWFSFIFKHHFTLILFQKLPFSTQNFAATLQISDMDQLLKTRASSTNNPIIFIKKNTGINIDIQLYVIKASTDTLLFMMGLAPLPITPS